MSELEAMKRRFLSLIRVSHPSFLFLTSDYLMIDRLCYMTSPADAINELITQRIHLNIPGDEVEEWKSRATGIVQDPALESQQRPFILQTFTNYGTEHHVQRLLQKWNYDEYLDYRWANGRTVLIKSSFQGRKEIVSLLCEYGASVDFATTDEGRTALHGAAYYNHDPIVEILLERKADVTLRTQKRHTALDLARTRKSEESVKLLEAK